MVEDIVLVSKTNITFLLQVVEMESSLRAKQDSAQREMEDMSTRLQQERENTTQEVWVQKVCVRWIFYINSLVFIKSLSLI